MKFFTATVVLAISSLAVALPAESGLTEQGDNIKWKVPQSLTVSEAQSKCGEQAQLSCCNKAIYAGDTTDVNSGLGGGLLSHLIGTGSGAQGLGLFRQCSKLDASLLVGIRVQDILNQHCKQNIACCANDPHNSGKDLVGAALPCVALGSIL